MQAETPLINSQRWKIRVALIVFAAAFGLTIFDGQVANWLGLNRHEPTLVATVLGVIGFVWASVSIVCTSCGLKLFWYATRKKSVNAWGAWFANATVCPRCSHKAGQSRPGISP
jgi:DNA-directed RNA polymerase subunit RPC12/RpoP